VQFPQLPVFSDPAPVPEAVRHVAGLLNLVALDSGAQRVDRPAGNIEHVSGPDLHPVQAFLQPAFLYDGFQVFSVGINPVNQPGSRRRVQNIPRLAFPEFPLMAQRVRVVRVHLNGKALLRVQQLQHQRERFFTLSCQPVPPDREDLPQGFSAVRAVGNPALMAGQR